MFAETRPDPHNAKALHVAVAAHDFEVEGGKPQIGKIGIFEDAFVNDSQERRETCKAGRGR
jgi:hypothetical protein